jgi:hypothetical protein
MQRALRNIRSGRLQRSLALTSGLSTLPLAFEIYLEHYKGSFGDKWEWSPIALTPPLLAAWRARSPAASASRARRCRSRARCMR